MSNWSYSFNDVLKELYPDDMMRDVIKNSMAYGTGITAINWDTDTSYVVPLQEENCPFYCTKCGIGV